ncbi:aspartate/glutamate racemase family protein [Poritiphilus flavus]|uniref:Amino acid racemase n=1 Tax=Poritiphilus flavus TaxID=2697053 RepID=A0A6L9EG82_9FLAO|nr:aspartate/glutamate racemase family protein [Poritiphilus flavus]NAS13259.1 amino acid racemase [Poritiphilus flavus]
MKTIGLIGGMSWESSKVYYEYLNRRTQELLGGSHSSKNIMVTVDFAEIERWSFDGNWEAIGELMKESAQKLELAGADIILLCTNTIHLVSDAITQNVNIPFIHIADATGEAIKAQNLKKVGLLGTAFTMEKDFYTGYIRDKYDIEVIIPKAGDRQTVHKIIYDELVKGIFTEESRKKCMEIIQRLSDAGAEGIILGCTELPLLIPEASVDLPTFDTSRIHVYKAVDWALDRTAATMA